MCHILESTCNIHKDTDTHTQRERETETDRDREKAEKKQQGAYFFKSLATLNDDVGPEVADGHWAVKTLIEGCQRGITQHHVTAVVR